MPPRATRRHKRVPFRKRRMFRRRRRYRRTANLLPARFCTKLRYYYQGSIDPGAAGTVSANVFRANSVYDPDLTGAGNQPRGFDQLMNLYENFQVIGSKVVCRYASRNASTYDVVAGISLRSNSSAETQLVNYVEQKNCKSKMLASGASAAPCTIAMSYKPKKIFGTRALSQDYVGTASSDPTNCCYFHIFAAPIQSVDSDAIDFYLTIEYIVVFTRPADVTQS